LNRKRTVELCTKMIEADLNLIWFCELRANTVDEELLTLMYKAGLRSAAMAVESASPRILKDVIKKGITLDQAQDAVKILKRLGVAIKVFFTYSYPTETKEDVKMTLDFIRNLEPDLPSIARLLVYPGTPLHKYAAENNLLPKGFSWFKYYSFYDSLSNPTFAPVFVDKLTTEDFIWIRNELAEISGSPTLADRSIFELVRNFIKSLRKVKSKEDFALLRARFVVRLKQFF
ncbi:MAG: radical SAM protein, partial [Nitrospirae bacterium]|nr:radical SAM protein [Nitrospirota bacterium]